jgi:hypothetical protein
MSLYVTYVGYMIHIVKKNFQKGGHGHIYAGSSKYFATHYGTHHPNSLVGGPFFLRLVWMPHYKNFLR